MSAHAFADEEPLPGSNRTREARHADGPTWRAPVVVERIPCRIGPTVEHPKVPKCANIVEVTDEAMAAFATFSKRLRSQGETPLELSRVFMCDACRALLEQSQHESSARRRVKATEAIRYLKQLDAFTLDTAKPLVGQPVPPHTKAAVEEAAKRLGWLEKVMGLGYVNDLLRAIEEKRGAKKSRTKESDL